jgi:hypothetical protein
MAITANLQCVLNTFMAVRLLAVRSRYHSASSGLSIGLVVGRGLQVDTDNGLYLPRDVHEAI